MQTRITKIGIFIWLLATTFFFYEFFLRVFLGTIADDVIADLFLTANQFSMITASYYITYGLMQTPVGILVDKFGSRLLLTIACLACAIGVLLFSVANSYYTGILSRLLIGFGSSFAFVCLLVLSLNWFPKKHFGFLIGLSQFLGAIGPMTAGAPLAMLVRSFNGNWRLILFLIGFLGILLTLFLAIFIRNKPKGHKNQIIFLSKNESLSKKIIQLLKNPQVWVTLFYAGFVYVSLPLLGAYWGVSYLESRGFIKSNAAFIVSMLWLGLAIGCPLIGKVSDKIRRRKPLLTLVSFLGLVISFLILFFPSNNPTFIALLFFLLGSSASGQSLSFAIISENVPEKLKATSLGINNTSIMLLGAFIPQIVSTIIQYSSNGAKEFSQQNFESGLVLMPVFFLIAFFLALFALKETYCRSQQEVHYVKIEKNHN
jgi:MFS family permease